MSLMLQRPIGLLRLSQLCALFGASVLVGSCGGEATPPKPPSIRLASIVIDGGSRTLERGSKLTLTATAKDTAGRAVSVPIVWRSTSESIVRIGPDGQLTAGDTGFAVVTAASLGVTSEGATIHVVWQGPGRVATFQFNPPSAVTPNGEPDSIRVLVTNIDGSSPVPALVRFSVGSGGGTLNGAGPVFVRAGQNGRAAAKWRFGPNPGSNTVTAEVVGSADSLPVTWVQGNPVTFNVTTYPALQVIAGDNQTAQILSALPVEPAIRLVDAQGNPRAAIPITFSATGNGRVARASASTAADGTVSPGVWTLGDASGDQQLIVTVEAAKVALRATATGTPIRFSASNIATVQSATCTVGGDSLVSCMGASQATGIGDTVTRFSPTRVNSSVRFATVMGGLSHFCGTTTDAAAYCWGPSSYVNANPAVSSAATPTRVASPLLWRQISPGGQHTCGVASDNIAYCWGQNNTGQLGDNTQTLRTTPQPVFGGFRFTVVTSGSGHSCGIQADSTALCWGLNSSGQIGDGSQISRQSPTAVSGAMRWKSLGAGNAWTCGLAADGMPYCWGASIGSGLPTSFPNSPAFATLSVGAAHACGLTSDGKAYCWGDNSSGQLGDSTSTSRSAPTEVVTNLRFASISAGVAQTCGITIDGLAACWGTNSSGELGVSAPIRQLTPRYIVVGVNP